MLSYFFFLKFNFSIKKIFLFFFTGYYKCHSSKTLKKSYWKFLISFHNFLIITDYVCTFLLNANDVTNNSFKCIHLRYKLVRSSHTVESCNINSITSKIRCKSCCT